MPYTVKLSKALEMERIPTYFQLAYFTIEDLKLDNMAYKVA
jgi:hypothetical protein